MSFIESLPSITSGLYGIISPTIKNSRTKDTFLDSSSIEDVYSTPFGYSDYDSLQQAYNPLLLARTNYKSSDIRNTTAGEGIYNTLSGITSGALAGSQLGGKWGALAGSVLGAAGGIGGWILGDREAQRAADNLNAEASLANSRYLNNYNNNALNISNDLFNTAALNINAFGGKLNNYTKYKLRTQPYSNTEIKSNMKYTGINNYFAYGGNTNTPNNWSNMVSSIDEGGTHEQNSLGGVPYGVDSEGTPNLVEEGEVVYNDYVFSNRLKPTKKQLEELNLPKKFNGKTFAEIAKDIQKESSETPNDPISKNTLEDSMSKLAVLQEDTKERENIGVNNQTTSQNTFDEGGILDSNVSNKNKLNWGEIARFIPAISSSIQALSDSFGWTNKEDYTNADLIRKASRNIRNVSYRPVGNYLGYTPFDTNYESNRLANTSLGAQRSITNASSGNRAAAIANLLSLNRNTTESMGDTYRKALDYNNTQRQAVAQFNNSIDQTNAQNALRAVIYNQQADQQRAEMLIREAQLRDAIETTASGARSTNLSNAFNNIGNVGVDRFNSKLAWDFIKANGLEDQYRNYMETKSLGGKIQRTKKKRGLTY